MESFGGSYHLLGSLWRGVSVSRVCLRGTLADRDSYSFSRSALYQPSELKTILDKYITAHSLLQADHRIVLLDDELGRAVGVKKPQPGEKMNREEVLKKLKASVNWVVSVGGVVK